MKERHGLVIKARQRHGKPAERAETETSLKWRLLRAAPGFRPWGSLDEYRQCVLCERTFSGREVRLERDALGLFQIRCPSPGCTSSPSQWIHPGNPLVSEDAWKDWIKLLDSLCEEPAGKADQPAIAPTPARTLQTAELKTAL